MIKDTNLLITTLLNYLKSQIITMGKSGAIINLDATLMSAVNVLLAKRLESPYQFKVITCVTNSNKFALTQATLIAQQLEVALEIKDLSKEYESLLTPTLNGISLQKRLTDSIINAEADAHNLLPLSNQCYSQWAIEFPHKCYQSLDQVHMLNRLFYSELKQLAKSLGASDSLINREPSHYLHRLQVDKDVGFTYEELESFIRNPSQSSLKDKLIAAKLVPDNKNRYICPIIQRPSNLLG
jgi:hypothetical protein